MKSLLASGTMSGRPGRARCRADPAGHAVEALHQLIAAPGLVDVLERVQPDLDPLVDVVEQRPGQCRAADEEQQADEQPGQALGGDVEDHDERAEEQQRRAQVTLEDEHAQAGQQATRIGPRSRPRGRSTPSTRRPASASTSRLDHEVAAKNTIKTILAASPGWNENPAARIQMRAPLTVAPSPGTSGSSSSTRPASIAVVGVALQHPVVAHQHDDRDEPGHPHRGPGQLGGCVAGRHGAAELAGGVGGGQVEPVDDDQAQPVDQRDGRSRTGSAYGAQRRSARWATRHQGAQPGAVAEHPGGQRPGEGQPHRGVGGHRDEHREHQHHQLGVAPVCR